MSMTPQQDSMLKQLHTAIVGDEGLGHTGLVKRMKNVEELVEDHDPIIKAYMTRKEDGKKIKMLIIGCIVSFFGGLAYK